MKILDFIACLLVLVGALNWGLVGVFNFDLVEWVGDLLTGDDKPETLEDVGDAISDALEGAEDVAEGGRAMTFFQRVVYIVVGASAVFMLLRLPAKCGKKSC